MASRVAHHDVVVVGSGFAGLGMAIALKREGEDDFVVLERGDALGGTWRDNSYPGCACDVPAPLYSFSFAPKRDWSRLYAPYHEIRDYMEDCADRFGVRPHLRFGAEMTGAAWDEDAQRWSIEVDGAPAYTARILVAGFGGLSRPGFPDVEGLDDFAGPAFHTAEWDHDADLAGKRVAVIGTGASAIQVVPRLAKLGATVSVFQRTPPWVIPKLDRRFGRVERFLLGHVPGVQRALRALIYGIHETVAIGNTVQPRLHKLLELIGRANIRWGIKDPALRAAVTPDYTPGCKRLLVSNDWYPALAGDHVELVTERITRATAEGLVTGDGALHAADAIVYGTGFRPTDILGSMTIQGRDGVDLEDAWQAGMTAHKGTMVAGFPNAFMLVGPNTGTGHNSQIIMIEAQLGYVIRALRALRERGAASAEVRPEVQRAYNEELQARMARTVWLQGGCQSWYLDAEGRNTTLWPGFTFGFRRALATFRVDEHVLEPARQASEAEDDVPAVVA